MWIVIQILLVIVLIMAIILLAPNVYARLGRPKISYRPKMRNPIERGYKSRRGKVDYILYVIIAACLITLIIVGIFVAVYNA